MKALSVPQPWASRIASGAKRVEYRSWSTKYRGPLLIVASRRPRLPGLPLGLALCVAELVGCTWDRQAGGYAWQLRNIRPLAQPFPVKGCLGLYEVEMPEE